MKRGPTPISNDTALLLAAAKFWEWVVEGSQPNDCWSWVGPDVHGYGRLSVRNRGMVSAHRFSWELHFGPIPEKIFVCHKCDNPPCCNPTHLFLGTAWDNANDAKEKGRLSHKGAGENAARGDKHGNASVTHELAEEIRRLLPSTYRTETKQLAARFGVSLTIIHQVATGKHWTRRDGVRIARAAKRPRKKPAPGALPHGERHWAARLTEAKVADIKTRFALGESQTALGKEHGVSQAQVSRILHGLRWAL